MDNKFLNNFKDGVVDGLIHGTQNEKAPKPDGYKQGYDFGLTLWQESLSEKCCEDADT